MRRFPPSGRPRIAISKGKPQNCCGPLNASGDIGGAEDATTPPSSLHFFCNAVCRQPVRDGPANFVRHCGTVSRCQSFKSSLEVQVKPEAIEVPVLGRGRFRSCNHDSFAAAEETTCPKSPKSILTGCTSIFTNHSSAKAADC